MNSEVYNVIIIGNEGVGKSTIVNTLKKLYQKIDIPENNTNCTTIYILKNCYEYAINIVEINDNIYENGEIIWSKLPNSINGVIICYDVTNKDSLTNITDTLAAFSKNSLSTFLVGCKANSNDKKREIKRKSGVKIAQIFNVPFIELNINAIEEQVKMFFEVFLEMIIKNKVVIESNNESTEQLTYNPLEILKKEGNYNQMEYDADVVMYPIANFYRLNIDDESENENEYPTRNNSTSSFANSNITSSSLQTDETIDSVVEEVDGHEIEDIYEEDKQENIRKKTLMNMRMRSLKVPKGSHIHGFDILDIGNDEIREGEIAENYKNSGLQPESNYSINKLIERMTSEGTQEIEFTKIFLIFYRKFLRPSELLDLLMDRFEQYDNTDNKNSNTIHPVQLRVCNVLIHWISEYWSDFQSTKMRFTLQVFIDVCSCRPSFSTVCSRLENLIYRQSSTTTENEITWGIPDIDDSDSFTNTATPTIANNTPLINNSFNSSTTTGTVKPYDDSTKESLSSSIPDLSDSEQSEPENIIKNEVISMSEALKMTNLTNESLALENSLSTSSNNVLNSQIDENNNVTTNSLKMNFSNNSLNDNNTNNKNKIDSYSQSRHGSHSSIHSNASSSLPMYSSEQFSLSNDFSLTLTEPNEFILNQDNTVIAQQLCLIEFEIFKRINPRDLLQHIWGKRDKNKVASSSVAASIQHFNFISSWITTQILEHKKAKHRAKVLGKFMKIAQHLRNYNNYNTLMAFVAGINCVAIKRLKQTRQILENRTCARQYKELETLLNSEKSFSAYRLALKQSELPCVPYLGVFLRDLLYIDEANKGVKIDENGNEIINMNKYLLMGDIIMMIKNFQLRPYPFQINVNIINAINCTPILSDEDAYKRSLKLEPRAQKK